MQDYVSKDVASISLNLLCPSSLVSSYFYEYIVKNLASVTKILIKYRAGKRNGEGGTYYATMQL